MTKPLAKRREHFVGDEKRRFRKKGKKGKKGAKV